MNDDILNNWIITDVITLVAHDSMGDRAYNGTLVPTQTESKITTGWGSLTVPASMIDVDVSYKIESEKGE